MAATKRLIEMVNIVECITPVDFTTAANTGDWVSLKHYTGVLIVIHTSIGTQGQDPDITVEQATAVAGTGNKALNIVEGFDKVGATTIPNGVWTRTTSSDNTFENLASAENAHILAIDIQIDMLDTANGYDCVQCSIADVGANTQLGSAIYIMYGPRIEGKPDAGGSTPIRMPSPLVD